METKICKKCLLDKSVSGFSINSRKKDNLEIYCKVCCRIKASENRAKEKSTPHSKECNTCGEIKTCDFFDKTSSNVDGITNSCKDCLRGKRKEAYKNNKEAVSAYQKLRRVNRKEKDIISVRIKDKEDRLKNKDYRKAYMKTYGKRRKSIDPLFKLMSNIRSRIIVSFSRGIKSKRTIEILGCSIEDFKKHVESQFESWMSWDNYGICKSDEYKCTWHLDHIIPVIYAKDDKEVCLLNHWSNFQPLCGKQNLEKNKFSKPVYNLELGIYLENNSIKSLQD
jgi:hypothetical protein